MLLQIAFSLTYVAPKSPKKTTPYLIMRLGHFFFVCWAPLKIPTVLLSSVMALLINTINTTTTTTSSLFNLQSLSFLSSFPPKLSQSTRKPVRFRVSFKKFTIFQELNNGNEIEDNNSNKSSESPSIPQRKKRLSEQSSWEAKDAKGNDYLYRLGAEADNINITVGARSGVIDDLFAGNFLGKDCNAF